MAEQQVKPGEPTLKAGEPIPVYKPTPTQDENDRAAMGEHVVDKEPDGSPVQEDQAFDVHGRRRDEERAGERGQHRSQEARQPGQRGTYEQRTMTARQPAHQPPKSE